MMPFTPRAAEAEAFPQGILEQAWADRGATAKHGLKESATRNELRQSLGGLEGGRGG